VENVEARSRRRPDISALWIWRRISVSVLGHRKPEAARRIQTLRLVDIVGEGLDLALRVAQHRLPSSSLVLRTADLSEVAHRATLIFMRSFTAVIERDPATGLFVGYVPGWPGAHSQGASVDELRQNLEEVVAMLLEDGEPKLEGEFVGTQTVKVA